MTRRFAIFGSLFFLCVSLAWPPLLQGQPSKTEHMTKEIQSMPLLAGLSKADIQDIQKICKLKEYPGGTALIKKGQKLDRLYLILTGSGEVRLKDRSIPFGKDSLLGEVELVDPVPAVADVFLVSDCRLVEIEYAALDRLLRSRPKMGLTIMRNLASILSRKIQGMTQ